MDLDIRGEMEAAAAEMESAGQSVESSGEDASPASHDETSESPSETPEAVAPPTGEPVATPQEPSQAQPDEPELPIGGSIPVPRVRKILENARTKARAEAEAKLQEMSWAQSLDRSKVETAMQIAEYAEANPIEYLQVITSRLRSDPALAAEVDRIMVPRQPQAPVVQPEADPKPQPDVLLEDGRLVYSADQLAKVMEWQERKIDGKLNSKFKPIEEREQQHRLLTTVEVEAKRKLAEVAQWPGMAEDENRKLVAKTMAEKRVSVDDAYRMSVLPKLTDTKAIEERVRKQVLADLKQKSRASTLNPQATGADPTSYKGKTIREILELTATELGMQEE